MRPKRVYRKLHVQLSEADRRRVRDLLRKGCEPARVMKRLFILSLLDKSEKATRVSRLLEVSPTTVRAIGQRYVEEGLEGAIYDRPRDQDS